MDRSRREEQEAFREIDKVQRLAICMLLDCAPPKAEVDSLAIRAWLATKRDNLWNSSLPLAAIDALKFVPRISDQIRNKDNWTDCGRNEDLFFGPALRIANFCLGNDLIKTYSAFDFLFVRLLGGVVRPLNPALFVASLLHHSIETSAFDSNEIDVARSARLDGWGTHEPVWIPEGADCPL